MPYYARKNGITKEIQRHTMTNYVNCGWEVYAEGQVETSPYYYEDVSSNRLEPININGEEFFGYSSFFCINTKTYVQEPTRTIDGSIPDINDYDTFIVPRVKLSFSYMTIHDFRRFLKAVTPLNEFPVSYYDYELDRIVSYKMYIEPREMATIYNKGFELLGITNYEVSLIGTLNDMDYLTISYYDNVRYIDIDPNSTLENKNEYILFDKKEMIYGQYYSIDSANNLFHNVSKEEQEQNEKDKIVYRFKNWNTKPDGSGLTYLKYETIQASNNLILYAQWDKVNLEV